jgi:tripartite-type tricarboxylate transporter receptor subunit TctC
MAMRIDRRRATRLFAAPVLLVGLTTLAPRARAQMYPARPIRIIVPYPAGGPYDGIPRLIAQWITAQHGWPIVLDNRAGATGAIGVTAAKQAPPDGYTLVVATTSTHGSMPALKRTLPFDPVADFAPVILMADAALALLVRDDVPAHDLPQLVAMLRARPGRLNYSAGGHGSPQHLAAIAFFHRAGLPQTIAVHVPFAGLAPALTALLAGSVQFMFTSTGPAAPHIASGRLRALATMSRQRSPRLPDVPTLAELGLPGFDVVPWCGLSMPTGTPAAIVTSWNELANEALREPRIREQVAAFDYDVRGGTTQEFAEFVALDIARYRKLAEEMGLSED